MKDNNISKMSQTIYVLKCENDKYYIGKTNRPLPERISEHFYQNGSQWTKKYRPIKVIEEIKTSDNMEEDIITKKYMSKYGIENCRGGTYTQIILPDYQLQTLRDEICTIENLCFNCGKPGHYASNCKEKL